MSVGIWYWLILVIWILFNGIGYFRDDTRWSYGGNLVLLVLLVLNGIAQFGSPVK